MIGLKLGEGIPKPKPRHKYSFVERLLPVRRTAANYFLAAFLAAFFAAFLGAAFFTAAFLAMSFLREK